MQKIYPLESFSEDDYLEKFEAFCIKSELTQISITRLLLKGDIKKHYQIPVE
jgi:hypothetical protein